MANKETDKTTLGREALIKHTRNLLMQANGWKNN